MPSSACRSSSQNVAIRVGEDSATLHSSACEWHLRSPHPPLPPRVLCRWHATSSGRGMLYSSWMRNIIIYFLIACCVCCMIGQMAWHQDPGNRPTFKSQYSLLYRMLDLGAAVPAISPCGSGWNRILIQYPACFNVMF